jgi:hypothetical protein
LSDGEGVFVWGSSSYGQLGLGDFFNETMPSPLKVRDNKRAQTEERSRGREKEKKTMTEKERFSVPCLLFLRFVQELEGKKVTSLAGALYHSAAIVGKDEDRKSDYY